MAGPLGFEPRTFSSGGVSWDEIKEEFQEYVVGKYEKYYARCIISYLDRFFGPIKVLRTPGDVMRMFNGLSAGQQHNLNRAIRAFFNYLEALGYNEGWLNWLKKAVPKDRTGVDLHVPEPNEVVRSLLWLSSIPLKYQALWSLCLDGGVRLVEAIRIVEGFSERRLVKVGGFFRYEVGAFRESKQAYYAYMLPSTLKAVQEAAGTSINERSASRYFSKYGFVAPKYLRKFAFDKMIELGVPESVADFMQGRVPRRVGAKHYMVLRRQADRFYPRYGRYVSRLRAKALTQFSCHKNTNPA